jgi:hypothetical protein
MSDFAYFTIPLIFFYFLPFSKIISPDFREKLALRTQAAQMAYLPLRPDGFPKKSVMAA